jgi:hypothetical protein
MPTTYIPPVHSVVGIRTKSWAGNPRKHCSMSGKVKRTLLESVRSDGRYLASYLNRVIKLPGREANHSPVLCRGSDCVGLYLYFAICIPDVHRECLPLCYWKMFVA